MTKLLKDGNVVSDTWVHVSDDADLPETGGRDRFVGALAVRSQFAGRA